jgi:dihydrolipoamide dehydrogenase
MQGFDLVVVGAGSGLTVASVAADHDESVAVIDEGPMGGTCLNRGCIPSKQLVYHADVLETIHRADEFHIDAHVEDVAFADIVNEVNADVGQEAVHIRESIEASPHHTLFPHRARFVDDRTLAVPADEAGADRVRGDKVVIAAGTRPTIPPVEGIEDVDPLTSREALQLTEVPDRLVILGGGYIAAEMAHVFGTFGAEVAIVGRRPHLLPEADREIGEALTRRYADRFTVHTGYEAHLAEADGEDVLVHARPRTRAQPEEPGEGEPVRLRGDELLVAAGRRPNTDRLDVHQAGVATDETGFVRTDKYLRTSAENVWALGDIVGEHLYKHAANHEAQAVARNIYTDDPQPVADPPMPWAAFASPEVAGVGQRERDLDPEETTYATSTYRYEDTARGDAMHAEGFVKVVVDEEGHVLGCHIIGPDASTLIQQVVTAVTSASGKIHDVLAAIHIHPALPEVVQRAFAGPYHLAGDHEHHHGHDQEEPAG